MKKLAILIVAVVLLAVAVPVLAKGPTGPAGKSNKAHLYLHEKDEHWDIVEDGAWGKMTYDQSGSEFDFVFNGHGLNPAGEYTLIYYPDPWPGTGLICLGDGVANPGGNVHIMGNRDIPYLPTSDDENFPDGAKIWLVLTDDVTCGQSSRMDGWNPASYLFEYDLIKFNWDRVYVETVTIDGAYSGITPSTASLESDVEYLLVVNGTYRFANWGDYGVADAEWAYRNDGYKDNPLAAHGWTVGELTYPSVKGLDVLVDGTNVNWGDFDAGHKYQHEYTGIGSPVSFSIYDSGYSDNSGSLTVDIYKI